MTVTKKDLVELIQNSASHANFPATEFVKRFFEVISKSLEAGEAVKISGFGNFTLRDKKERVGRNPKTLEEYVISARKSISFRSSNMLKLAIKNKVEDSSLDYDLYGE